MTRLYKKFWAFTLAAGVVVSGFTGCDAQKGIENSSSTTTTYANEISIVLSDDEITMNGKKVNYSEITPDTGSVYLSNDIIYYEDKDSYESGNLYGEGTDADKHTSAEAAATTVVNIVQAGTYRVSGSLSLGQIRVDLGEDAFENPEAVVTLILDGVDVNCDVAPAVLFLNVYECDNQWDADTASSKIDTSAAGANVIIADGSVNNIGGSYVAKIYKDTDEEKKLWKQDGAFYSYMSMNINGENENTGVLNITAENEGLDTELHLTINGGNINIYSDNDGINTNEDGVSVTTINGGNIHIIAGLGEEGDGVDSNGWLVINGGTVVASANPAADAGLDSDMGSYINGGTVVALGSTMDWAESDSEQITMNLQFADYKENDSAVIVTKENGSVVFAYDPSEDEVVGSHIRKFMGAVISCANFTVGGNYNIYIGGTVNGSETAGIYDVSSVTGFKDAVQQEYSGTDVAMRPGIGDFGIQMGGMGPDKGQFEKSEFDPENKPEDRNPGTENIGPAIIAGEKPEGKEPPEGFGGEITFDENGKPVMPEYMTPFDGEGLIDENGNPIGFGGEGKVDFAQNGGEKLPAGNRLFYMQDKVNFFSGISDAAL